MKVFSPGMLTCNRNRAKLDTCIDAKRRCRLVRERGRSLLMNTSTFLHIQFVSCENEVGYFRILKALMRKANGREFGDGVDSSLWLCGKSFTNVPMLHDGHLLTPVLGTEINWKTTLQY